MISRIASCCVKMKSNRLDGFYESTFTIPELAEEFLEMKLIEISQEDEFCEDENEILPLADSKVYNVSEIVNAKRLTYGEDVKEVYLIELPSHGRLYEPGDTIGILPYNQDADLIQIFRQLKIDHIMHQSCKIIKTNLEKKYICAFLNQTATLFEIFKNFVDIRCLPKKSLIRLMAEYTDDIKERVSLEELCSKEGAKKYEEEILNNNKTFMDLLSDFPTCCPPVLRLLENLPTLLPRAYSIASSPLSSPNSLSIVFTVSKTKVNGLEREGVCTGMLKSAIKTTVNSSSILFKMYYRKKSEFLLPKNNDNPLILIGPGSGVAPFIGFLEHLKMQEKKGVVWLFYGCRYKMKDYLFKKELEEYQKSGVLTKLIVSFSREPGTSAKYVQDNIEIFGKEICDMICNDNAIIYVCGDAKGLRKDVMNTFVNLIKKHKGLNSKEASAFVKSLQKEKRYLQDVWL